MLRVYDAETGRFLWEGQLNLLEVNEEGPIKVKAVIAPKPAVVIPASRSPSSSLPNAFLPCEQSILLPGRFVWQDQFTQAPETTGQCRGVMSEVLGEACQ